MVFNLEIFPRVPNLFIYFFNFEALKVLQFVGVYFERW